jgi:hypothetical protein
VRATCPMATQEWNSPSLRPRVPTLLLRTKCGSGGRFARQAGAGWARAPGQRFFYGPGLLTAPTRGQMMGFVKLWVNGLAAAVLVGSALVGAAAATTTSSKACASGYSPCLPVAADLDCGQIPDAKKPIRVTGDDQYALDRDDDGLACEVAGDGGGAKSPWGLILRKPPRKEASSAKVGQTMTVAGWSPASARGQQFVLCAVSGRRVITCQEKVGPRGQLKGTVQVFDTWPIQRRQVVGGVFKLTLQVKGKIKASDTVPVP